MRNPGKPGFSQVGPARLAHYECETRASPGFGGIGVSRPAEPEIQSLRRYEPDQVRRISALPIARPSGFSAPCRGSPWNDAIMALRPIAVKVAACLVGPAMAAAWRLC